MKKLKNIKARLLSLSLALAMVLSLAMGMSPMKVMANDEYATPQDILGNLYDTPIGTANVTVTVTENGVQCNNFPELQPNCKWVYSYHNCPSTHADYANIYQRSVSNGKADMSSGKMGYPSVTEYPTRNQYVHDVPENGLIPLGDNGKGILNVYQVYNHAFRDAGLETLDEGYRFYCANTMLIFDTSQGGDVLNGYVDSGNQGGNQGGGNENPPATTTTLTYEVVGGSGTMDSETLTVGESFTLPDPSFTADDGREFFGWLVYDSGNDGDRETDGYAGVEFTPKSDYTYKAIAYYGYSLTIENLPENTTVEYVSKQFGNPKAIVVPEFAENMMEGNVFMIKNDSITSAPSFTGQNGKATFVQIYEGYYMYFVQNITGPVKLTYNAAGEPTPVTYSITLDRTNYADGYVDLYTYNSDGATVESTQTNNDTIQMPEGGKVRIFAGEDFTVTAVGATISERKNAGDEGYYYELTSITADTTVVVNKVTSGSGGSEFNVIDKIDININPEFLADLAEGTYNEGKFSPFELGNGSKEGNANIYEFERNQVALYCGNSRVGNGDPVDLENETYHVVDIIKISDQQSRHRFANVMTALSGDDKFTFDLLMASNNDNPIQYNFFATVTYEIAPGGEQGGGSNPPAPAPTPTPDNGSNGGSNGGSSSSSDSSSTPSATTPSTSTPSTAPITVPVSNGGNDNVLNINASLSGETAKVNELTAEEIDKVAKNETKDSIEINLSETGKNVKEAALPVSSLNEIARIMDDPNNKLDNITIKLSTATVEVSEHTLKAVLSKTTGNDLRLVVDDVHKDTLNDTQKESVKNQNVHMCIDAYFISNGVRIGDFQGGTATIRLPFEVPAGLNGNGFSVWYVGDDGTIEKHNTQYVNGELVFTVSHFSDYVVVYDGAVKDNVPKTGESTDYTTLVWTSILAIGVLGLVLNRQKRRQ